MLKMFRMSKVCLGQVLAKNLTGYSGKSLGHKVNCLFSQSSLEFNLNSRQGARVLSASSKSKSKATSTESAKPELDSFLTRSFLDLEKIDENLFRTKALWQHKGARGVYGGQLIGNSLVAASESVPKDQHLHSIHSYFHRKGSTERPILFHVDRISDGRTYCTRSIKAVQSGHNILTMQTSFKKYEPTQKMHQSPMPKVPFPDELESGVEMFDIPRQQELLSTQQHQFQLNYIQGLPIKTRWVNPGSSAVLEPLNPKRCVWIKAEGHIGDNLHENVHKCCLAYLCDILLLPTVLMPYGLELFHNFLIASLDYSMWFHAPCRADEWMLCEIETGNISDGRAICHGRIWDINGNHLTTVTQEGVFRPRGKTDS